MSGGPTADIYVETLSVFNSGDNPYEPLTTPEVADALDCARRTVYKRLEKLVERGKLKTKKTGAHSRIWWQSPPPDEPTEENPERAELEAELRRQMDLFENTQDIANVGAWEYDIESGERYWTEEVSRIHGVSADYDLSPEESIEFYHPDDRESIQDAFERAVEEQEAYDVEVRFIDANDTHRWVRTRGKPRFEDGELVRLRGTIQDITERKERERKLERMESLFENAERLGDVGAWEFDPETKAAYWSDGTRQIHEVDDDFEPTVETGIEFYHPDDQQTITRLIEACIETGEPYSAQLRLVTANDNLRWVYTQGAVIEKGETRKVRGYIQDITEYKEREAELEQLTDEYEAIFDNTTDHLALIDVEWSDAEPTFRYVRANHVTLPENKRVPSMIEGKTPVEVAGHEVGQQLEANYRRCLDAGETITYEEEYDFPNTITLETTLTPIQTDGRATRIVASSRDITMEKERKKTLEQYQILAQTASDVIVTIDPNSVIQEVNPAVEKVFGYEPEALRGESLTTLMPGRSVERHVTGLQRNTHAGDSQVNWEYVELPGVHADGTEIPLAISFSEYEHDGQQYFTGIIRDISDREERDQLRRLDQLNTVIRNIGKTVSQADTREEIEQTVCETLLEFDHYQLAVIGAFSPSFDHFEPWTWAGTGETYLKNSFETDSGPPLSESLGATAAKTGELQAYQNLGEVPVDFWQDLANDHGIKSYAAIPLVYEGTTFGVIGVYADQPGAFDEQKQTVLAELGETVGYALSTLERKAVLDRVIEMEFRSEQLAETFQGTTTGAIHFELDSAVPLSDEALLEYWSISGIDASTYRNVVEEFPSVLDTRLLRTVGDTARFEVTTNGGSIASLFKQFDGELKSVTIQDGNAMAVGEFPEIVETEAITQRLRKRHSDFELSSRRRVLTPTYLRQLTESRLTDRQLTVLRTAYFAGYFGESRLSTGEELATRLGIAKQTFHQHLRKAQEGVFEQLFETSESDHSSRE